MKIDMSKDQARLVIELLALRDPRLPATDKRKRARMDNAADALEKTARLVLADLPPDLTPGQSLALDALMRTMFQAGREGDGATPDNVPEFGAREGIWSAVVDALTGDHKRHSLVAGKLAQDMKAGATDPWEVLANIPSLQLNPEV